MSPPIRVALVDGGHFRDEKAFLQSSQHTELWCLTRDKVEVKRLRRKDTKRAASTIVEAAEDDPIYRYSRDTPDAHDSPFSRKIERLRYRVATRIWAIKKLGMTVEHGRSIVCAGLPPAAEQKRSKMQRLIVALHVKLHQLLLLEMTKEQRRRLKEIETKMDAFAAEHLGEAIKEMRVVNALATHPDFQQRGYGGALVDAVTQLADAEGRSTYLFSSNPANTEFYNSHGFSTLAELVVGDNDVTWKKPPLPIALMVRIYGEH